MMTLDIDEKRFDILLERVSYVFFEDVYFCTGNLNVELLVKHCMFVGHMVELFVPAKSS